jgi:hypothetical protein
MKLDKTLQLKLIPECSRTWSNPLTVAGDVDGRSVALRSLVAVLTWEIFLVYLDGNLNTPVVST